MRSRQKEEKEEDRICRIPWHVLRNSDINVLYMVMWPPSSEANVAILCGLSSQKDYGSRVYLRRKGARASGRIMNKLEKVWDEMADQTFIGSASCQKLALIGMEQGYCRLYSTQFREKFGLL